MKTAFQLIEEHGLTLHGDIEHFAELVRAEALAGPDFWEGYEPEPVKPALVDWKASYLACVESGCITLDELREANAELDATNRQVEILTDALAESRREIDAMIALARADEREACVQDIQMHIPRSGRDTTEYQRAMRMIERIQARSNT